MAMQEVKRADGSLICKYTEEQAMALYFLINNNLDEDFKEVCQRIKPDIPPREILLIRNSIEQYVLDNIDNNQYENFIQEEGNIENNRCLIPPAPRRPRPALPQQSTPQRSTESPLRQTPPAYDDVPPPTYDEAERLLPQAREVRTGFFGRLMQAARGIFRRGQVTPLDDRPNSRHNNYM